MWSLLEALSTMAQHTLSGRESHQTSIVYLLCWVQYQLQRERQNCCQPIELPANQVAKKDNLKGYLAFINDLKFGRFPCFLKNFVHDPVAIQCSWFGNKIFKDQNELMLSQICKKVHQLAFGSIFQNCRLPPIG